jgi:adenosylmethionine-8-amino-7-oxononanoate aminotransferase
VQLVGEKRIAAVFIEPIAGSTGVLVPPRGYLERIREICDRYGILLVFDEVICGFGRTGQPFAAISYGVTPDLITMAKALTNGAQPMGAVAVRDSIYQTIVEEAPAGATEFFHGYTYSAHPAACAAALATLKIYENERLFAKGRELSGYFLDAMFACRIWRLSVTCAAMVYWRESKSNAARHPERAAWSCRASSLIVGFTSRQPATVQSSHLHSLPAAPRSTR